MKSKLTQTTNEKGFTLIEILTVIAIIAILAATLFTSLSGQRERARVASAMETGRSAIPAAVECFMTSKQLAAWGDAATGGNAICAGSTATWPSLGSTGCSYSDLDDDDAVTGNKRWRIDCAGGTIHVSCFGKDGGNCCLSNNAYVCN